jgi:hypothetical protein
MNNAESLILPDQIVGVNYCMQNVIRAKKYGRTTGPERSSLVLACDGVSLS